MHIYLFCVNKINKTYEKKILAFSLILLGTMACDYTIDPLPKHNQKAENTSRKKPKFKVRFKHGKTCGDPLGICLIFGSGSTFGLIGNAGDLDNCKFDEFGYANGYAWITNWNQIGRTGTLKFSSCLDYSRNGSAPITDPLYCEHEDFYNFIGSISIIINPGDYQVVYNDTTKMYDSLLDFSCQ